VRVDGAIEEQRDTAFGTEITVRKRVRCGLWAYARTGIGPVAFERDAEQYGEFVRDKLHTELSREIAQHESGCVTCAPLDNGGTAP
jgi:hypothetical protein